MVARLDDPRVKSKPVPLVGREELQLLHVEAKLVQAVETLVEPVPLVRAEQLVVDELVPEQPVAGDEPRARLLRRCGEWSAHLGRNVRELTGQVLLGDLQVVLTLAVRERLVQLARLRVHEVGGERARVAAEERVRQRAVAPEEPRQVKPHEQLRAGVEKPVAEVRKSGAREERAEGQRVVEMPGDQHRIERLVVTGDHAHDLDDRHLRGRRGRAAARTRGARPRPAAPSAHTRHRRSRRTERRGGRSRGRRGPAGFEPHSSSGCSHGRSRKSG